MSKTLENKIQLLSQHIDFEKISESEYIVQHRKKVNFVEGKCYILEFDTSLLSYETSSMYVDNWNCGSIPKYNRYKVEVIKVLSNMIQINGIALSESNQELNNFWTGWVPVDKIKVVKEL